MARVLLWLVLLYVVVRAVRRLLAGVAQGMSGSAGPESKPAVNLVRDPVCGTFVVPSRALTAGNGADTRYFCSERCRQAWTSK
jgi:YHS domain-containing protein